MKKTWKVMTGIALTTVLLFGCSQEGEIKNVTLSKQEQENFVGVFIDQANQEGKETSELVKELNNNISGLDEQKASDSIDALLFNIYQHGKEMNVVIKGLQNSLTAYEEKGVDFNKKEDIEKVEDAVLKAFLEQVESRYMVIGKENGEFVVVADFDKILTQYKSYMSEPLKAMIEFSKEEFAVKYYDEEKQKMNLDIISERIVLMEKLEKKHPDSYYTDWFSKSKYFYYQLYFGTSGESITKKDQTLLPDVETHFQSMMEEHKGTNFAKDIEMFFEIYKQNGNNVNGNVYVFLTEMTKKEHETISQEDTESKNENDQAKNAIKEAIEKNKEEKSENEK